MMQPPLLKYVTCNQCECVFGMPTALYEAASASSDITFYCPYGHSLCFPKEKVKKQERKDNVVPLRIVRNEGEDDAPPT